MCMSAADVLRCQQHSMHAVRQQTRNGAWAAAGGIAACGTGAGKRKRDLLQPRLLLRPVTPCRTMKPHRCLQLSMYPYAEPVISRHNFEAAVAVRCLRHRSTADCKVTMRHAAMEVRSPTEAPSGWWCIPCQAAWAKYLTLTQPPAQLQRLHI